MGPLARQRTRRKPVTPNSARLSSLPSIFHPHPRICSAVLDSAMISGRCYRGYVRRNVRPAYACIRRSFRPAWTRQCAASVIIHQMPLETPALHPASAPVTGATPLSLHPPDAPRPRDVTPLGPRCTSPVGIPLRNQGACASARTVRDRPPSPTVGAGGHQKRHHGDIMAAGKRDHTDSCGQLLPDGPVWADRTVGGAFRTRIRPVP